ncbi:MAG: RHS repeat-associated core domain-containing protein, partial [Bacteroidales bacterium]|nr:RHS repeat-associated core domain-containing protein [Bacteroidales bacterium]
PSRRPAGGTTHSASLCIVLSPQPCYGRRIFSFTPQVCDMTLTTCEIQRLQQWQNATMSTEVPPCNLLFSFLCFVSFFFSGRRKKERNEGKNFYYHMNHLGSTAFVTDQNQNVTQGFLYAPFGEITTEFAPLWQNGTLPKYSFNAKELDEETGMYYYEARYYKPPVFTSRDAMMDQKPWLTPYHYCSNNPVGKVDPSGMLDEDNPVFTSDGIYLGCTKEGYTGTVLICDAPLNISEFTADELLSQSGGNLAFTYDDVRYRLSNNAKSNIWTHIVSQWEGLDVHGETFSMGTIKDSRIAYDKQENIYNWCTKRGDNSICGADEYGDSYETTVENIQASVVFHEWYGHIIKGYSDDNNNHSICYSLSLQSPIYKNTTLKYKRFINQQLDYYLGVEIGIIIDSFKNQIGNR